MKALISKFQNRVFKENFSKISFIDINKIKEFQASGNFFGLFISKQDTAINNLLEEHGITADFTIQEDGSIYFKEGYQYFDYEPFEKEEVEKILTSLTGDFTAKLITANKEIEFNDYASLNQDAIYTSIVIENCSHKDIIAQLKQQFRSIVNISLDSNRIFIFSKKSSLEKSLDVLCGLKNIMIDDVSMLADYYSDYGLIDNIDNLYALKEDNGIDKDVYIVESIGECLDNILNDDPNSLFLSKNFA